METKQIITWLQDKAKEAPNHAWVRMLKAAAYKLEDLTMECDSLRAALKEVLDEK